MSTRACSVDGSAGKAVRLTMTPKLKLREQARNVLLSCILKSFLPGRSRTKISTQMTLAPKTQAVGRAD